jgi:hypothetical protein
VGFKRSEERSDFLEAAALQKLIVAAMKKASERHPQELAALLHQICDQYNAASSQVQSEVAELIQELKNLVGEFDTSTSANQASIPSNSNPSNPKRWIAVTAACAVVSALSVIGFQSVRQSTAISPPRNSEGIAPQSPSWGNESGVNSALDSACSGVNPKRVAVSGYRRSNGQYIFPHERTAPNQTTSDNLATCR